MPLEAVAGMPSDVHPLLLRAYDFLQMDEVCASLQTATRNSCKPRKNGILRH